MWSQTYSSDELYHHGILGMKWGIRRYQNKDGTLTPAGRKHLGMGEKKRSSGIATRAYVSANKMALKSSVENAKDDLRRFNKASKKYGGGNLLRPSYEKKVERRQKEYEDYDKKHQGLTDEDKTQIKEGVKSAAKTALKIGVTVAVAYAGYKVVTDPRIRRMAERGIDRLKGVNTKQSIEQLIANSGPQIVKNTKSNSMDSLKFAKQLSSNGKIRTDSVKDFNTVFGNTSVKKATTVATKTSGPKLEFGGPSSSSSSSSDTMERLLKNNKTLSDIAKSSASNSNWATEYGSYTRQLLNKNNAMLKNMTMDDLKKLDLY